MSIVFDYDSIAKHRNNPNLTEEDEVKKITKVIYEDFRQRMLCIMGQSTQTWDEMCKSQTTYTYWLEHAKFVMKHGFHI